MLVQYEMLIIRLTGDLVKECLSKDYISQIRAAPST